MTVELYKCVVPNNRHLCLKYIYAYFRICSQPCFKKQVLVKLALLLDQRT